MHGIYLKEVGSNEFIPVQIKYTKNELICVREHEGGEVEGYYHVDDNGEYIRYKCFESFDGNTYISDIPYVVYEEIELKESLLPFKDEMDANILKQKKTDMVEESKVMLAEFLSEHPILSDVRGDDAYYSVTQIKQQQMYDTYSRYQNMKRINPEAKLYWNATGEVSEEWNEDEFLLLMSQIEEYVRPFVIKQQELEVAINAAETFEEADSIDIHY